MDWAEMSGDLINRRECVMILAMDSAFRAALSVEIKNNTAIADARSRAAK